jgi:hypothetical protein
VFCCDGHARRCTRSAFNTVYSELAVRFTNKAQRGGLFQDFMDCGMDLGKVQICHTRRLTNSQLGEMVLCWKTYDEILEKVKAMPILKPYSDVGCAGLVYTLCAPTPRPPGEAINFLLPPLLRFQAFLIHIVCCQHIVM